MEQILASVNLDNNRSIHIAELSRQTIIDAEATHLGFGGLFVFETNDAPFEKRISVLCKVASIEAAFRMVDIWSSKAA